MNRLKSTAAPRALSESDIDKLKRFPFKKAPHLADSVRLFLFIYYADGMNFQDVARLKRSDLKDGRIFYTRKKTGRPINIPVDEVLKILATSITKAPTSSLTSALSTLPKCSNGTGSGNA